MAGKPGQFRKPLLTREVNHPRLTLPRMRGNVVKAAAALHSQNVSDYAEKRMKDAVQAILARSAPLDRRWVPSEPTPQEGLMAIGLPPDFSVRLRQAAEIEQLSLRQMGEKYLFPVALADLRAAIADL